MVAPLVDRIGHDDRREIVRCEESLGAREEDAVRGERVMARVELERGRPGRAIEVLAERLRESAAGSLSAHRVVDLLLLAEAYLATGAVDLAEAVATIEGREPCSPSA